MLTHQLKNWRSAGEDGSVSKKAPALGKKMLEANAARIDHRQHYIGVILICAVIYVQVTSEVSLVTSI